MGVEIKTGGIKLVQVDGKYNVWTKKVGNSSTKMLTLHGLVLRRLNQTPLLFVKMPFY